MVSRTKQTCFSQNLLNFLENPDDAGAFGDVPTDDKGVSLTSCGF